MAPAQNTCNLLKTMEKGEDEVPEPKGIKA